jgi:3-hydroxyisobutyrate dehydrogenase-like beta-hydroxyacid dehydrogenase
MSIKIQTRIAYLGMGIMGASMAVNLARAGFPVAVWNRTAGKASTQRALDAGCRLASTV